MSQSNSIVGRKIVGVRCMTRNAAVNRGWHPDDVPVIVLVLDDGSKIIAEERDGRHAADLVHITAKGDCDVRA